MAKSSDSGSASTGEGKRGRGRPSTGERVAVRIPADDLARIDGIAAGAGKTRAEVMREMIQRELARLTGGDSG